MRERERTDEARTDAARTDTESSTPARVRDATGAIALRGSMKRSGNTNGHRKTGAHRNGANGNGANGNGTNGNGANGTNGHHPAESRQHADEPPHALALRSPIEAPARSNGEAFAPELRRLVADVSHDALRSIISFSKTALDADRMLQRSMAAMIELRKTRYAIDPGETYRPGAPLKLLFAGYSGTRNTGADVRVEEMIRQVRHLFGDDHLDLSLLTIDEALSRGYFRTVKQLRLPQLYPKFLFDTVHRQHGVIACEGSMFKSKFANALATMMVGSLGLALAEQKLAIGYGGEAGKMDSSLEALVKKYCQGAFILARNAESTQVLGRLGIASKPGTDTAWTFEPAPSSTGEALLRSAGWDGKQQVLAVAPINPFYWPVRPDLMRGAVHALTGAHADAHYASVYFHASGAEISARYDRYLDELADAVRRYRARTKGFVILVGMERLDRDACERLRDRLADFPGGDAIDAPLFVSDDYDMYQMVSVLRRATYLVSSRYHAIVTSMPGSVLSVGVTMDERIRNLMADRGQPELSLEVDDPSLADAIDGALMHLESNKDEVRAGIRRSVAKNLVRMGQMGQELVEHIRERHPDMPIRGELGLAGEPLAHLPPLGPDLVSLLEEHT